MKHNIKVVCQQSNLSIDEIDGLAKKLIDLDDKDFNEILNYITDIRDDGKKNKKPIKKKVGELQKCPKCNKSDDVISYGYQGGKQKFKCKKCNKYFLKDKSLPALGRCHRNTRIERIQIKALLEHRSLRSIAEELDISLSTAFAWRHKTLSKFKEYNNTQVVFEGRVEMDEIYFPFSTSGNINAYKNLKTTTDIDKVPDHLIYREDKKVHSRGKSIKKAGLNRNFVCVPTATNVPITTTLAKCSNFGKPSTNDITTIFKDKFDKSVVLITDHEKSTHKFASNHNINVIQTRKGECKENINHINNLHSRFREHYKQYHSVSTKYLDNYMALEIFHHQNTTLSADEKIDKFLVIMNKVKVPLEYKELKATRYPDFVYKKTLFDDNTIDPEPNVRIRAWDRDVEILSKKVKSKKFGSFIASNDTKSINNRNNEKYYEVGDTEEMPF